MNTKRSRLEPFVKILAILFALQGLVLFPFLFQIKSTHRDGLLFGFSLSRILVYLIFGILILVSILFFIRFQAKPKWASMVTYKIENTLKNPDHYAMILFGTSLIVILGLCIVISFNGYAGKLSSSLFGAIFFRIQPIILWFILASAEISIFLLVLRYGKNRIEYRQASLAYIVVFCAAVVIAYLYWLTLQLNLSWISGIQSWYWQHIEKTSIYPYRFLILFTISLVIFAVVYLSRLKPSYSMIILMLYGYLMMIGVGFVEGNNGLEILRLKIVETNNQAVYSKFSTLRWVNPLLVLKDYENIASSTMHLDTKPPGTLFTYSVLQKVSEKLFHPADDQADRMLVMTQMLVVVLPLLSSLTLLVLYRVSKKYLNEKDAIIPCMIFLSAPNLLLMPIGLDKTLYPLLFIIGIWVSRWNAEKRTYLAGLWSGLYLYAAIFFSFSLVPILLWVPVELLMTKVVHKEKLDWRSIFTNLLGVATGFIGPAILMGFLINYNIIVRYIHTMQTHQNSNRFVVSFSFLWESIKLNNIELAAWSGFGMIIFMLAAIVKSLVRREDIEGNKIKTLTASFLIIYIFLNVFSQMKAEVGRLWMFLLPIFALIAGYYISQSPQLRKPLLFGLIAMQLVTTYFLLACQCPCWWPL